MTTTDISDGTWTFYEPAKAFPGNIRQWDSGNIIAELHISLDAPGGGTYGEFGIEFYDFGARAPHLSSGGKIVARLNVFSDGMRALNAIDLIGRLAALDGHDQSPDVIRALLSDMGMVDKTMKLRGDRPAYCDRCSGRGVLDDVAPSDRLTAAVDR